MLIWSWLVIVVLSIAIIVLCLLLYKYQRKSKLIRKETTKLVYENENLVDELDRVKEELHLVREKAGESDRLKSAFLCNMSHELRTPLHAIMGFSGLIANPVIDKDEKITYANIINHNIDLLLEIINDIFDISQVEAGVTNVEFTVVNVNELLNSIQTWLNLEKMNQGKEDIIIKISKASKSNGFSIMSEAYKLKRALSHLADNALKYTNSGIIEIGYTLSNNDTIDFFVKDEGIGFSSDKLEFIFSGFRQVDETPTRQFGGLGLGLTVAHKFAVMLNGTLWAESKPGIGSTFCISIPYIKAE